jgi:8-amino-7-oxononanoate synthase
LAEYGLALEQVPVYVGTLGKALGSFGAFVAGSDELIEHLIQAARPYIYTTAMPPAVAAATLASLDLLQTESWRIDRLQQLIALFRAGAQQRALPMMPSTTAIQPLLVHSAETALRVSSHLQQHGFLVGAIRPPTVPDNSARLRITLTTGHSEQDVEQLLDALALALESNL